MRGRSQLGLQRYVLEIYHHADSFDLHKSSFSSSFDSLTSLKQARAARLMAEKEEEYSRWASNRRIAEKSSAAQRGPTTREALAWN